MIRKQFYVTPEIDRQLTILAREEGKPVAQVHREILEETLKVRKRREPAGAVLLRMAERAFKGPGDLSANLFSYLYGEKSSRYGKGKRTTTLTKAEVKQIDRFINEHRNKTSR